MGLFIGFGEDPLSGRIQTFLFLLQLGLEGSCFGFVTGQLFLLLFNGDPAVLQIA